jgi:coproporphyrinogen III oxidase
MISNKSNENTCNVEHRQVSIVFLLSHARFSSGTDMTPYYLNETDGKHFHRSLKKTCDKHDRSYYPKFKKWCDDYFNINYRSNERRGIGGIFFDDLNQPNQEACFDFVKACANTVIPSYVPIVTANYQRTYNDQEREWQLLRRGRYAEFNLVLDRGTKFGLQTPGARIESILMSLPPIAKWRYGHNFQDNSPEMKLMKVLKEPIEWV